MSAVSQSMFKGLPRARVSRQFQRLNLISNFPNSAVRLPTTVKSLDLVFKNDSKHGHMGAKKFWRNNLPTIQFHNPELAVNVTRVTVSSDEESIACPAKLKVLYEDGTSKEIDMKHKYYDDIMGELKQTTGAEEVPAEQIPVHEK